MDLTTIYTNLKIKMRHSNLPQFLRELDRALKMGYPIDYRPNTNEDTLLFAAFNVIADTELIAEKLINEGADLNLLNREGRNYLTQLAHEYPCKMFNKDFLRHIVHGTSELGLKDNYGNNALSYLLCTNYPPFVLKNKIMPFIKLLLDAKVTLTEPDKREHSELILALKCYCKSKTVIRILEHCNNINKVMYELCGITTTALLTAIENNYSKTVIRKLLSHGADPNITDADDVNALIKACSVRPEPGIVKILLKYTDNINHKSYANKTALGNLCERYVNYEISRKINAVPPNIKKEEILDSIDVLLKAGADINIDKRWLAETNYETAYHNKYKLKNHILMLSIDNKKTYQNSFDYEL